MNIEYIVVSNDQKKGEASAERLINKLANGFEIMTAVPTRDCVHYILKEYMLPPTENMSTEEEAQKELLMNFIEAFNRAGKYDGNNIRIITSSFNLQNFLKIERNNRLKGEKLDE